MINIVLYQPEIFPNTGNIIRTCFSTNAKLHIIKPISFDLHPKWLKRYAAGKYLSDIRHEIHESYQDFSQKYKDQKIFYLTRYAWKTYSDVEFKKEGHDKDIFIMLGRESTGIPKQILRENLETCIRIPMVRDARSLNLANCAMLISYEIHRQLGFPNLSQEEVQKGRDWLLKD